jgi:hypothetical protein
LPACASATNRRSSSSFSATAASDTTRSYR